MAFKFETANERWKAYKQSIMEHPQHVPYFDTGTYSPGHARKSDGLLEAFRTFPVSQDERTPALLFDRDGNEYKEGEDFIYDQSGNPLVSDNSGGWVRPQDTSDQALEFGLFPNRYEASMFGYDDSRSHHVL